MSLKVLIIKLGALGDVIIATPHIEQILRHHEDAAVWLLTAPDYAALFSAHPLLRVAAFPRKGLRPTAAALHWVRRQQFDVIYDLQGSRRSALFAALSGAPQRVGLGSPRIYTRTVRDDDRSRHIFARLARLLESAGLEPAAPRPQLNVSATDQARVQKWLRKHRLIERAFVLLHAGSSPGWPSKRWEESHMRALAAALGARGLESLWIGAEQDAALNARLAAAGGIDASGSFSLPQLSVLARKARFAVTTDSGPMHLFATAGIPVYALFGPTDWRRSHAVGQAQQVLTHAVACSPCYLRVCPPRRRHRCLRELTPAQVLERLQADGMI